MTRGPGRPPKNANKDIRNEIGADVQYKMTDAEKIRAATGKRRKMDASHYLRMEEYKNKQLFWCPHDEADYMIAAGAVPVRRRSVATEIYKGINDSSTSEYESRVVDTDKDGNKVMNFLLCMDKDEYDRIRLAPQRARNEDIQRRLKYGMVNSDESVMPSVRGLQTYAPDVGNMEKGLRTELTHEV